MDINFIVTNINTIVTLTAIVIALTGTGAYIIYKIKFKSVDKRKQIIKIKKSTVLGDVFSGDKHVGK